MIKRDRNWSKCRNPGHSRRRPDNREFWISRWKRVLRLIRVIKILPTWTILNIRVQIYRQRRSK